MRKTLLLDVPHRQVVFVIPKMLRVFFKFKRKLLGDLCRCAVRSLLRYFQAMAGTALELGIVAVNLTGPLGGRRPLETARRAPRPQPGV